MSGVPDKATPLPRLRPELILIEGAPTAMGEPAWLIQDPLQHRYFQIDKPTYHIFSVWSECRTVEELLAQVAVLDEVAVDRDGIARLIEFVLGHKLADPIETGTWKALARERGSRSHSPLAWLAHNYLFFRVPLWQPQMFLEKTLPLIRSTFTRRLIVVLSVLGALGLYFASRQWDAFMATLQSYFTWEGAVATALAVAFVKILHEFGHAYSAVHFGCRVPTMGLAFMMMAPMLYTDVTDAWRLRHRWQRLIISAAGIMVELGIAAISLLAWTLLPDGPLRSVAFLLATTSLMTSLLINLNPLMRFDGYYLLSDWLGIENLQDRAFELARWKQREWLFGLGMPCPEHTTPRHQWVMIVYAWCVWIYRLGLFIGIALVVYYYFFKVLGIILFLFEIGYFIARPVWSELKVWYALRKQIRATRRSVVTAGVAGIVLLMMVVPWSTRVEIPAVVEPQELARIFPKRPARVKVVHVLPGQPVEAGAPLVTLTSPDTDRDLDLARIQLQLARMQHARRMADAIDREASLQLESSILSLSAKIEGLQREREELIVRSPLTGRVAELNTELHPDRWVGAKEMIALIAGEKGWIARGLVSEADLWRIEIGQRGTYIPEFLQRSSLDVTISDVSVGGAGQLEILDLSSTFGGRIAVNTDDRRRLIPASAQYPVRMTVAAHATSTELIHRGVVIVAGRPESVFARVWHKTMSVVLQESGF